MSASRLGLRLPTQLLRCSHITAFNPASQSVFMLLRSSSAISVALSIAFSIADPAIALSPAAAAAVAVTAVALSSVALSAVAIASVAVSSVAAAPHMCAFAYHSQI